MKVFIVAVQKKGYRELVNLGKKLECNATKSREVAEEFAEKRGGEVYSILIDDMRLVSIKAFCKVHKEALRIGAI